jgi:hypothetical protein
LEEKRELVTCGSCIRLKMRDLVDDAEAALVFGSEWLANTKAWAAKVNAALA